MPRPSSRAGSEPYAAVEAHAAVNLSAAVEPRAGAANVHADVAGQPRTAGKPRAAVDLRAGTAEVLASAAKLHAAVAMPLGCEMLASSAKLHAVVAEPPSCVPPSLCSVPLPPRATAVEPRIAAAKLRAAVEPYHSSRRASSCHRQAARRR